MNGNTNEEEKKEAPEQPLAESELDNVSGGVYQGDTFMEIHPPVFTRVMAFRQAGWDGAPSRRVSVTEVYRELAANGE